MPHASPSSTARARQLRQSQTDAETLLWRKLRYEFPGAKFRRQYPIGPFILDFYCPAHRLAIELDGGQHNLPSGQSYDAKRTAFLNAQNIRVLRFWNNDVLRNTRAVLERIWGEITPHPTLRRQSHPLPENRGEG